MRIRCLVDSAIRTALESLTARLAPPKIYHGTTGPYLSRWTFLYRGEDRWRLCLHFFHRSDEDRDLHTHPWAWAAALQLAGGYREERRIADSVLPRDYPPGSLNIFVASTAHRVDLLDPRGSWSLLLMGPIVGSWGFVDPKTWSFTPWRDALRRKGIVPLGGDEA